MAGSILDIKGVCVSAGQFSDGVRLDLFEDGEGPQNSQKRQKPHRASVIFGRNGSGKTTVANFIAASVVGPNDVGPFYDKEGAPITLNAKSSVRVFSEAYVRNKVLIKEDGLEAIVMLGDQALADMAINKIDDEMRRLGKTITENTIAIQELEHGKNSLDLLEKTAKACVKDGGWASRLSKIDGNKPSLTSPRWELIREAKTNAPRMNLEEEFRSLFRQYVRTEGTGSIIDWQMPMVNPDDYDEPSLIALLTEVLDQPTLSDREKRLLELARSESQFIVETARDVFSHKETAYCPMCQQEVTSEYKQSLVSSISMVLSKKADEFKNRLIMAELKRLDDSWDLPPQISSAVVAAYESALRNANKAIERCNALLSQRRSNLYSVVAVDALDIADAIQRVNETIVAINNDIEGLNAAIRDKDKIRLRLYELNNQIAHVDARDAINNYEAAKKRHKELKESIRAATECVEHLRKERGVQEARLKMNEIAAASINRFLASVYFDSNRFRLVPSGDVYKIESYGKPVAPKDISTGERNILALCYFFSESGKGKFEGYEDQDPQYLIIDDPVSSFDMENRIGICSLLRERIAHVFHACDESRVTILTHDAAVVAELERILSDIKGEFKKSGEDFSYDLFNLSEGAISRHQIRRRQYSVLLKRVYDYATSNQDDDSESYVIGNILRRVLEGYGTFNYGMGAEELCRDVDLKKRFGDLEGVLSNAMYRLALNDESHMQEEVTLMSPTICFERYSCEEKKKLARCVLVILNRLDPEHIKKQLGLLGVDLGIVDENLRQWEAALSVAAPTDKR